jgi:hypothetical protein
MRTNDARLRTLIRAALDGLAAGPVNADPTPELVFEILLHIGDATRADVRLSSTLIGWLEARTLTEINLALESAADDLDTWAIPSTIDDESLSFLLVRRDSTSSVDTAAVRWALGHGLAPAELTELQRLRAATSAFDARLGNLVTRSAAEAFLGERVGLLGASPWTDVLPVDESANVPSDSVDWIPDMVSFAPSDDVVTGYILHGRLARFVEGFAAKSPEFREELQLVIQNAKDDDESISFRARSWLKRQAASGAPLRVTYGRQQMAAATDEDDTAPTSLELGVLVGSAHGRLTATGAEVTLTVYAPQGQLASVELGGVSAARPDPGTTSAKWTVTITRPDAPVRLRVVATDGDAYDELLELTVEKP